MALLKVDKVALLNIYDGTSSWDGSFLHPPCKIII